MNDDQYWTGTLDSEYGSAPPEIVFATYDLAYAWLTQMYAFCVEIREARVPTSWNRTDLTEIEHTDPFTARFTFYGHRFTIAPVRAIVSPTTYDPPELWRL
jgi:hypothetical protein